MGSPVTYLELHSTATEKAKEFYKKMFGWKMSDQTVPAPQPFTYTEIDTGEGIAAGMMPQMSASAPSQWLAYIKVANLDAALRQAKELGATVLREKAEVKGEGFFGVLLDPTGAQVGLFEKTEAR